MDAIGVHGQVIIRSEVACRKFTQIVDPVDGHQIIGPRFYGGARKNWTGCAVIVSPDGCDGELRVQLCLSFPHENVVGSDSA